MGSVLWHSALATLASRLLSTSLDFARCRASRSIVCFFSFSLPLPLFLSLVLGVFVVAAARCMPHAASSAHVHTIRVHLPFVNVGEKESFFREHVCRRLCRGRMCVVSCLVSHDLSRLLVDRSLPLSARCRGVKRDK